MRLILRHLLLVLLPLAPVTLAHAQSEDLPRTNGPLVAGDMPEPDLSALTELFPDGMPSLFTPEPVANAYRLPATVQPPDPKKKLPTNIEYADGPLKWDLGANVTTRMAVTTIVPAITDPFIAGGAAGGNGEVKGNVRFVGKEWEFYGVQSVGAHLGDGTAPTLSGTITVGSLYKLPAEMAGGKIGTSLELNSADQRKTRVEYRQPFGPAEGFIAAEQNFLTEQTDHKSPAAVRAGINRKF